MEFAEFIRQFDRMCQYYMRKNGKCTKNCPMGGRNISQCRKFIFDAPLTVEPIVNEWSKNNPEKISDVAGMAYERGRCDMR